MKRKIEAVKMPRRRRSNLEMAGFSREHLKIIKRISDMSQVSLSRVGTDVIEIGMAAVVSKYQPMIEMEAERKERTLKLKHLFSDEPETGTTTGPGSAEEPDELAALEHLPERGSKDPGITHGVTIDLSTATLVRPGLDAERPGYEPETPEALGSADPEDNGEVIFGS